MIGEKSLLHANDPIPRGYPLLRSGTLREQERVSCPTSGCEHSQPWMTLPVRLLCKRVEKLHLEIHRFVVTSDLACRLESVA